MFIVQKNIQELKPYEKNPRKNDDAVDYVAASIKEFGFKVPIVIDKNNVIVAGHTRFKAAKKLKIDVVPCIIADDLSDEQIKAFRLADNKVSEFSMWDDDLLNIELEEIMNIDMIDFGFEFDFDSDDEEEEKAAEPKKKLTDEFIVPPLSIFDTRQGYWQERKQAWKSLGLDSGNGRDDALLGAGLKKLAEKNNSAE